ncbi:prolyl endopeptidase FAP-like [Styela clava]
MIVSPILKSCIFLVIISSTSCFPQIKTVSVKSDADVQQPFTFEDLYDSKFWYSSFYPSWVSDTEYIFQDEDGIQKMDMSTGTPTVVVDKAVFDKTSGSGWSLSADEQYFFVRTSYAKQWRHSYNGSYSIYSVTDGDNAIFSLPSDIQYIRWSPVGSSLVWVRENDIYYRKTPQTAADRLTSDGRQNDIYNGIPDWVYEEEMIFTRHVISWSPDGTQLMYLKTNDSQVDQIEFSVYNGDKYPEMVNVAYPKAGRNNPVVTLLVYDIENHETDSPLVAPLNLNSDHLFSRMYWYPDSKAHLTLWLNRVSNQSMATYCEYNRSNASYRECWDIPGSYEISSTGWIGNGGVPFTPVLLSDSNRTYITAFSNSEGFWHVAVVNPKAETKRFLTTGGSVVTSLRGYDDVNDWVYFTAAAPSPGSRNVYRVRFSSVEPTHVDDWECISCMLDQDRCQWVTPSFSPGLSYLVLNCGGPDVPMTTIQMMEASGNYSEPTVYENNTDLINNKAQILWPTRNTGVYKSPTNVDFLYEIFKPANFDETKKYPLLIEVYGGPGFQKVQNRWTRRWAQTHLVSQYEILVASFDGRGSGYRGDDIAHLLYRKLGQIEKEDTTEIAQYFADTFDYIDSSRIALWGWSYGGYTTTFTISKGAGVFKCGFAVAPLASRYFYDTIHTERYMGMPDDNVDGYEKCSILNANLTNFNLASYTIIHGTADDNVHFQNAALINKALVQADVNFDSYFYADEAHSISTGANANKHIYKLLTRKVRQCFGLSKP